MKSSFLFVGGNPGPGNPSIHPKLQRNILNPHDPTLSDIKKRKADQMEDNPELEHGDTVQFPDVSLVGDEAHALSPPTFDEGEHLLRNTGLCYTQHQRSVVNLMKILSDIDAPDLAFGKLMSWANDCSQRGCDFSSGRGGYKFATQYTWMREMLKNASRRLPSVIPVTFPNNNETVEVVTYEFAPAILSILQDPSKMTAANLAIDLENPLAKYVPKDNILSEAMSGSVYQDNFHRFCKNPLKDLVCPLICWFDKSHVTANGKFTLQPFMVTLAIFKETFRRTMDAWFVLGYLPAFQHSSAFRTTMKPGEFLRGYHLQILAILASYFNSTIYLTDVELPIGPNGSLMTVNVICPVLFIIQDMEEGDRLSGRFGTRLSSIPRQSRACNIQFKNMDATDRKAECQYVTMKDMQEIALSPDKSLRQKWSMHYLDNAFSKVVFMDPVRGIFGNSPTEAMHSVCKGPIETCVKIILRKDMSKNSKAALDDLCGVFHRSNRQTYRSKYPRTHFSSGITHLTQITAGEYVGVMFLFVILSTYDEGWKLIAGSLEKESKRPSVVKDVVQAFECLLCFDAWLRQTEQWDIAQTHTAVASAKASILCLMRYIKKGVPRSDGNGWKLSKFHEMLHLPDNMVSFGAIPNFMAESPEMFLKFTVKKAGKRHKKGKTVQPLNNSLPVVFLTSCSLMICTRP